MKNYLYLLALVACIQVSPAYSVGLYRANGTGETSSSGSDKTDKQSFDLYPAEEIVSLEILFRLNAGGLDEDPNNENEPGIGEASVKEGLLVLILLSAAHALLNRRKLMKIK